jgi:hypothetical protein
MGARLLPDFCPTGGAEEKSMEISKVLAELRAERALLDEVIENLEKLSTGHKKRGRPRGRHIKSTSFPDDAALADSEPATQAFTARPA